MVDVLNSDLRVKVIKTLKLSDGYENYPPSSEVNAYEEELMTLLKNDPQRIKNPSTKGVQQGNVSFDDRAVLIFKEKWNGCGLA